MPIHALIIACLFEIRFICPQKIVVAGGDGLAQRVRPAFKQPRGLKKRQFPRRIRAGQDKLFQAAFSEEGQQAFGLGRQVCRQRAAGAGLSGQAFYLGEQVRVIIAYIPDDLQIT